MPNNPVPRVSPFLIEATLRTAEPRTVGQIGSNVSKTFYGMRNPPYRSLNGDPVTMAPAEESARVLPLLQKGAEVMLPFGTDRTRTLEYLMAAAVRGAPSCIVPYYTADARVIRQVGRLIYVRPDPTAPFSDQVESIRQVRALPLPNGLSSVDKRLVITWEDVRKKLILRSGVNPLFHVQGVRFTSSVERTRSDVFKTFARLRSIHRDHKVLLIRGAASAALDAAMHRHTRWWTGKQQGTLTFGSTEAGYRLGTLIGTNAWFHGPQVRLDLATRARETVGLDPHLDPLRLTLLRQGFFRKNRPLLAVIPILRPLVEAFPFFLEGQAAFDFTDTGPLNGQSRSRVVSAPSLDRSVAVLPACVASWFLGDEATHLVSTAEQGLMMVVGVIKDSAVLDVLCEAYGRRIDLLFVGLPLVPGVPFISPILTTLLYGPEDERWVCFATDESNQDQHASADRLDMTRQTIKDCWRALQTKVRRFAEMGGVSACVDSYACTVGLPSLEAPVTTKAEASVSFQEKGLASGTPETKENGTDSTQVVNEQVFSRAISTLGGSEDEAWCWVRAWTCVPLRHEVRNGTIKTVSEFERAMTKFSACPERYVAVFQAAATAGTTYSWPVKLARNGDDALISVALHLIRRLTGHRGTDAELEAAFLQAVKEAIESISAELDIDMTLAEAPDFSKTDVALGLPNGPSRVGGLITPDPAGSPVPLLERSSNDRKAYGDKLLSAVAGPDSWPVRLQLARALSKTRGSVSLDKVERWVCEAHSIAIPDVWHSGLLNDSPHLSLPKWRRATANSLSGMIKSYREMAERLGQEGWDPRSRLPTDRYEPWLGQETSDERPLKLLDPEHCPHLQPTLQAKGLGEMGDLYELVASLARQAQHDRQL